MKIAKSSLLAAIMLALDRKLAVRAGRLPLPPDPPSPRFCRRWQC